MTREKIELPVHRARAYLEPGPVLLVTSAHEGARNVMTMGWHMVMEFTPSLVGCIIAGSNHSFDLIRQSRECVLNLPTSDMVDVVAQIGNCSGRNTDKFAKFGLEVDPATQVQAPLLRGTFANFECRLHDDSMMDRYNMFIFEIVAAQIAKSPKHPETLHYTGDGVFVAAQKPIARRSLFHPALLGNGR